MKYIYPVLLLLVLVSCQKEAKKVDHEKSDWAFYQLKGNVEDISLRSYALDANGVKGEPKAETSASYDFDMHFNEEGKLILEKKIIKGATPYEETTYNGRKNALNTTQYMQGKPMVKTDYIWDKTGNNTSITKRNPDNSQLSREEKKYRDTLLIEKIQYDVQDLPIDKTTYEYDKKGNLIKENMFLREETIQFVSSYKYDDNRRKIEEASHDGKGNFIYRTTFTYEGDKLSSIETMDTDGKTLVKVNKYTYDAKGNRIKEYSYRTADKLESIEEYTYDEKNQRTAWVLTQNGIIVGKMTFAYDDKGSQTEVVTSDGEGNIVNSISYTYEYDTNGNWTKKTARLNNNPSVVVERVITYYN